MIELKKLILDNFMCVEHAELDFIQGVNALIGSNGEGKSTVLQAIALCLLEDKRSDSVKEFIRLGATDCFIYLESVVKGLPLTISIKMNVKQSGMDREATYNDRKYKNSEVSDLLDTLELKYYSELIMSMQGKGESVVEMKPTAREVYFQNLFQFDFSKGVEELKTELSAIKQSIEKNTNLIEFNKKAIESRKQEIHDPEPLTFTDADVKAITDNISFVSSELENLGEQLKEKDVLTSEKTKKIQEQYQLQQSISNAQHQIGLIKSNQSMIDVLNGKIKECEAANTSSEENIKNLNAQISELNVKLGECSNARVDLSTKAEYINAIKTSKNTELLTATQNLATLKSELGHAQKHMDMIKLGTCPECGHAFDRTDLNKYKQSLSDSTTNLQQCEASLAKLKEEIASTEKDFMDVQTEIKAKDAEYANIQKDISNANTQISSIQRLISANNTNIESFKAQINQYQSSGDTLSKLDESISLNEKLLVDLSSTITDLDNKINTLNDVYNMYTAKTTELNTLQAKLNKYNSDLLAYNNVILQNKQTEDAIKEMENSIELTTQEIERAKVSKASYDEAIEFVDKKFPAYLILKTCAILEKEMNNFIHVIFPRMQIRLFQSKKGVEFFYTPSYTEGQSLEKEDLLNAKMASGFEKAILSIAFKSVLCKAYNLRFAFMDEIDQAGTEENSEAMFRAILANDLYDQLFVISHKPNVRDAIYSLSDNLKTYYVEQGKFTTEEPSSY